MAPQTAYFAFCDVHRAATKEKLVSECDGAKVSVAEVAKELGKLWKALSDEERTSFQQQAKQKAEEHRLQHQAEQADGEANDGAAGGDMKTDAGDAGAVTTNISAGRDMLPLSLIKRIIACDADVSRVACDALVAAALAAELFLQLLASRGAAAAKRAKRSTVRLDDFNTVVKQDRRLVAAGLRDVAAATAAVAKEMAATAATAKAAAAAAAAAEQPSKENAGPASAGEGGDAGDVADTEGRGGVAGTVPSAGHQGGDEQEGGVAVTAAAAARRGRPPLASKKAKVQEARGAQRIDSFFRRS